MVRTVSSEGLEKYVPLVVSSCRSAFNRMTSSKVAMDCLILGLVLLLAGVADGAVHSTPKALVNWMADLSVRDVI